MVNGTRWFVVDDAGRDVKGQPRNGFEDYQDAFDFAQQRYAGGVRIEAR